MKKILIGTFCAALMFSCGKDNPVSKKIEQAKEAKENISNAGKVIKESQNFQQDFERLSALEPLTNAEFKEWMPEEVNGMKRNSFKAGETAMLQISSAEAGFSDEEKTKRFSVTVTDGAGAMGASAISGLSMSLKMSMEEEDESGYKKTMDKNGVRAMEEYRNENTKIQLIAKGRYWVEATGDNMTPEETWKAVDALKLDKLPD
ncbi:MAG: hypothetical protein H3C39_10995 [Flavobacteriia bacterium]|nr:hypothetical protein [Flavobacteriia bacterium]